MKLITSPQLRTPEHREVEEIAFSLLDAPEIKAAREEVVKRYKASPSGQIADGRARMEGAIDELVFGTLLATISTDIAHPQITWNLTLPYSVGDQHIPGSRSAGEGADRIFRNVVVDPAYRYEIHGKPNATPSVDFCFEALPGPVNWGLPVLAVVQKKDIDIADDGTFVVTLDSSPSEGRRNHLQLPPGTQLLLLRDTLSDWNTQLPNQLSIVGLDKKSAVKPTRETMAKNSAEQLRRAIDASLQFINGVWRSPVNSLNTYIRDGGWGIVGFGPFSIKDGEALIVTFDPVSAGYVSLQVYDLWLRSVEYAEQSSSLNNTQAKANVDGSITYVISKADPGVHNWISTDGLNDGFLFGRWDLLKEKADVDKAVRELRIVKMSELAGALPNMPRINAEERKQMLAARKANYEKRLK